MSKHSQPLKRYLYISQHKIGVYDSQRPRNRWQRFLERLSRFDLKIKDIELALDFTGLDDPNLHQKMQHIIARINREQSVGTVDQPAAYIHDILPLFQVLMPSRRSYKRHADDPGFIYFGGGTSQTALALVGSPHHLIGMAPDEKPRLHSSDVPRLVDYINQRINEIVPGIRKPPIYDGLGAVWHADIYNEEPRIPLEFFACRIHDSVQPMGIPTKQKRVLLYTPIYVAYAD